MKHSFDDKEYVLAGNTDANMAGDIDFKLFDYICEGSCGTTIKIVELHCFICHKGRVYCYNLSLQEVVDGEEFSLGAWLHSYVQDSQR